MHDPWFIALIVIMVTMSALGIVLAIQIRKLAKEIRLYYLAKRAILTRGLNDE